MEDEVLSISMELGKYFGILALLSPAVWATSEALGNAFKPRKIIFALILGPLFAVLMYLVGWLPVLDTRFEAGPYEEVANGAFALASGLISTLGAKVLNDRVLGGKTKGE